MTSSKRRLFALTALLVVMAVPTAASAQRSAQDIESARQLYNQGMELRDKGDLKGALEKLRAAHALGNTPLTGIELCRTHAALRQPVEAREVCLGVARIPPLPQETPRSQEARNEAGKIAESEKPKIGSIRLKITGVPAGWEPTVTIDGAAVPAAALAESRAMNPGVHSIVAKVGTGQETRATLETKEGENRDLEIAVLPPPEGEKPGPVGPGPGPNPPPPPEKKNTFATVSFAIAGIAGVVGTIGGLAAISGESDLADKCRDKICGRSDWDSLDSAKTWADVATASFIIAGVALGAGLVSTLVSSKKSTGSTPSKSQTATMASSALPPPPRIIQPKITPVIGLGGVGLHGSF